MYGLSLEQEALPLSKVLQTRIAKYKREHPKFSSLQIATKFKISASAFNRIENGDLQRPAIESVLRILKGTGCSDIMGFIKAYYPELSDTYAFIYESSLKEVEPILEKNDYLGDYESFLFFLLAECSWGISSSYIMKHYGRTGFLVVEELINNGLLKVDKGDVVRCCSPIFNETLDAKTKRDLIINTIKKSKDVQDNQSNMNITVASLNYSKVKKEIDKIMAEAQQKINDLANNPDLVGPDYFYFAFISEKMAASDRN